MASTTDSFAYDRGYDPPAPIVEAEIHTPGRDRPAKHVRALIDTGADGTLVPIDALEEIGARYVGDAVLRGLGGDRRAADVYLISLAIGAHTIHALRVVAVSEGDELLLGATRSITCALCSMAPPA